MADQPKLDELPKATVVRRKRMRVSIVWVIPILAAVVAIGIAVQRVLSEGPTITIAFKSAHGVEAGKTFIKYKDVRIGVVSAVQLSEDYSKVLVKAKIAKHSAGLMVEDAKFWVVEPRISLSGVSGLSTLLSGNFIGFQAGKSTEDQRTFEGLESPPTIMDQPGRRFVLKARELGSLGVGDPIYYRGLQVGQIVSANLVEQGKSVEMTMFIDAPYDQYVTADTRFWNASGVRVTLGADGVDVQTESLASLIAGGVAFDTPDFATPRPPAAPNAAFTLHRNQTIAMKQPDPSSQHFVLHFNESVRGLSVGAPVTLYGLRVGEVTQVGLDLDPVKKMFRPRVLITFFPHEVVGQVAAQGVAEAKAMLEMSPENRKRLLKQAVEERGLRARLQTGSFITGELYVAFDHVPNAPRATLDFSKNPMELPVVPGGLSNIEARLSSILGKIDSMPLDAIGKEVKDAIASLDQTLRDADVLVKRVDVQWVPEGTKTLEDMRRAIGTADRVLKDTDATFFGKDSPAPQDLRDTLQEIARAARSVRVLLDYLERHPEILIRGKSEEKP